MLAQPLQWEHGTGSTVITSPSFPPPVAWCPGLGLAGRRAEDDPKVRGVKATHSAAAATLPAAAYSSSSADTSTAILTTMIQELLIVLMFMFLFKRASKHHLYTQLGPRTTVPHNNHRHSSGQRPITSPCLHSRRSLLLCAGFLGWLLAWARLTFAWLVVTK